MRLEAAAFEAMERHLALFARRPDGTVMAGHCRAVFEQTGLWPKDFPLPVVPDELLALWDWYWELRRAAALSPSAPGPLLFSEILAWSRLKRLRLSDSALHWLTVLDTAFLTAARRGAVGAQ